MVKLIFPKNDTSISTYTQIQESFLKMVKENGIKKALEYLIEVKLDKERSFPKPIKFVWESDKEKEFILELSEKEDFSCSIQVKTNKNYCYFTNLKIGQKYFWRVNRCKPFTFETIHLGYRFIKLNGAINVRDLGGINIKQGLIYRGSEIEEEFKLTKKGCKDFTETLGIKSEISMREEIAKDHKFSKVCPSVVRVRLPYRPYKEVFEEKRKENLRDIFNFLADKKNYPVYFHCKGGADRTGMLAIYLRAIVGETEDQIFTDFELTSLSTYGAVLDRMYGVIITETTGFRRRTDSCFLEFLEEINKYKGNTFNERIKNFLLSTGIEQKTLDKIVNIIKA